MSLEVRPRRMKRKIQSLSVRMRETHYASKICAGKIKDPSVHREKIGDLKKQTKVAEDKNKKKLQRGVT